MRPSKVLELKSILFLLSDTGQCEADRNCFVNYNRTFSEHKNSVTCIQWSETWTIKFRVIKLIMKHPLTTKLAHLVLSASLRLPYSVCTFFISWHLLGLSMFYILSLSSIVMIQLGRNYKHNNNVMGVYSPYVVSFLKCHAPMAEIDWSKTSISSIPLVIYACQN